LQGKDKKLARSVPSQLSRKKVKEDIAKEFAIDTETTAGRHFEEYFLLPTDWGKIFCWKLLNLIKRKKPTLLLSPENH